MTRTIYNMDLHDVLVVGGNLSILRVHHGWIYEFNSLNVFVPFTVDDKVDCDITMDEVLENAMKALKKNATGYEDV